ncbi:MAG: hypothetical protein M9911_05385 [Saprospiraceae bacterium]|nr:hypothetical protein [Saprospiraceae bacterium]
MKAKEVKQEIIENLFPFLKINGYKKRKNGFTKQDGDFSLIVFYSWLIGDNEFPTSFSFMVASHLISLLTDKNFNIMGSFRQLPIFFISWFYHKSKI